jgi:hypothetical protein
VRGIYRRAQAKGSGKIPRTPRVLEYSLAVASEQPVGRQRNITAHRANGPQGRDLNTIHRNFQRSGITGHQYQVFAVRREVSITHAQNSGQQQFASIACDLHPAVSQSQNDHTARDFFAKSLGVHTGEPSDLWGRGRYSRCRNRGGSRWC